MSSQFTAFGRHGQRAGGVAEFSLIRRRRKQKRGAWFHRQGFAAAGRDGDINISRIGGDAVHRAFLAPEISADQADVGAVIVSNFGNLTAFTS